VLGGPIGAYDDDLYPTLKDELNLLEMRLSANRPTIGICLGAQLMARALGARVYPAGLKEIGWGQITFGPAGCESVARHLGQNDTAVLHWHGDTFDLPKAATLLASTEKCRNQAFSWGGNALGFQFHPEATAARLEQWFIGHACEIAGAKLSVAALRADTVRYAARWKFGRANVSTSGSPQLRWWRRRQLTLAANPFSATAIQTLSPTVRV